jgi:hypothetical protein
VVRGLPPAMGTFERVNLAAGCSYSVIAPRKPTTPFFGHRRAAALVLQGSFKTHAAGSSECNATLHSRVHATTEGVTTLRRRQMKPPAMTKPDPNKIKVAGSGSAASEAI